MKEKIYSKRKKQNKIHLSYMNLLAATITDNKYSRFCGNKNARHNES